MRTYYESSCSSATSPIGPYDSSYWCAMTQEFGVFKVFGRGSRQCTLAMNMTFVQVDTYGDSTCHGDVMQMETIPLDVCIPTMSGSLKLSMNPSRLGGDILYMTYSSPSCSSSPMMSTPLWATRANGAGTNGMCTMGIPGSTKGSILYIVSTPVDPPPGAVVELIYPSSQSTLSACVSGDEGEVLMIRYLRPDQCLTAGSYNQYEKISCGSDPSKYNYVLDICSL